jgi:hypothetical protein
MDPDDALRKQMAALLTSSAIGKEATKKVAAEKKSEKKSEKKGSFFGLGGSSKPKNKGVSADRILEEMGPHFNDLWNASNPHVTNIPVASKRLPGSNPVTKKNENGCWVIYNSKTDTLRAEDFTAPGDRDSCIPGVPPLQSKERVAAFFHTHPNTNDEGYNSGPSGADVTFANDNGFPGVVRSQLGGLKWFGPTVS